MVRCYPAKCHSTHPNILNFKVYKLIYLYLITKLTSYSKFNFYVSKYLEKYSAFKDEIKTVPML